MTGGKVLDASAVGAVLFGEAESTWVRERVRGADLFAPALLHFEIANICLKKARRTPVEKPRLIRALALLGRVRIRIMPVDWLGAVEAAERWQLSAYDASYLWLAETLALELVTLDKRLHLAAKQATE